ncbi:Uncharacterised protein [Mycobacteroides abscessus subsp. massiliense]|uniref:hypothetical protein n=1 Tax=Mycobacteroides abscessus TaxID=36809 RepID=UPI0009A5A5EF|nr:hypothetical protein [Mycobacteroides abscessus]SKE69718.1 Uncharacterised protein [Mycobacteroides abscessus subsp. massiliense]SKH81287.1 Uncharacterised protein [Mycobacteroides abscessus subsp. massiliense]SKI34565.1 Uncharacterised protein [Mycobacteroides abscessus subsp. massiliense]SKJ35936.1 Uncharacterised protein [Mycobacteroides abscessus subsp. massiliense]SKK23935.1 Uncharacterised protein [Mycobacteroides abscessus subsp. massiliense]
MTTTETINLPTATLTDAEWIEHHALTNCAGRAAVAVLLDEPGQPYFQSLTAAEAAAASWYAKFRQAREVRGLDREAAAETAYDPISHLAHAELGEAAASVQSTVDRYWDLICATADVLHESATL